MSATVSSEPIREVDLAEHHLDDATALVAKAGWNQVPADWRMMTTKCVAFGYEDSAGRLIASAVVLPYEQEFGWISMVLVRRAWHRWRPIFGRLATQTSTPSSPTIAPFLAAIGAT